MDTVKPAMLQTEYASFVVQNEPAISTKNSAKNIISSGATKIGIKYAQPAKSMTMIMSKNVARKLADRIRNMLKSVAFTRESIQKPSQKKLVAMRQFGEQG